MGDFLYACKKEKVQQPWCFARALKVVIIFGSSSPITFSDDISNSFLIVEAVPFLLDVIIVILSKTLVTVSFLDNIIHYTCTVNHLKKKKTKDEWN